MTKFIDIVRLKISAILILLIALCSSNIVAQVPVPITSETQMDSGSDELFDGATHIWDSVDLRANWFMDELEPNRNLDDIPSDFKEFYIQFISDSTFQLEHIAFDKLVGVLGYCEITIRFSENNWNFKDWDFTEFFGQDNNTVDIDGWDNTFYFNKSRFYYQFRLKEIGWIYKTGFEKVNGEWYLTLYYENAC